MPQCSVDPDRRTTALVHWDLMPSGLNASNCSSPDGESVDDAAQQCDARPRGEVHGQALADHQRRTVGGISVSQAGRSPMRRRRGSARAPGKAACAARRRRDSRRRTTRRPGRGRGGSTGCPGRSPGAAPSLRVHGQELPRPVVEVRRADGHRRRVARRDRRLATSRSRCGSTMSSGPRCRRESGFGRSASSALAYSVASMVCGRTGQVDVQLVRHDARG